MSIVHGTVVDRMSFISVELKEKIINSLECTYSESLLPIIKSSMIELFYLRVFIYGTDCMDYTV